MIRIDRVLLIIALAASVAGAQDPGRGRQGMGRRGMPPGDSMGRPRNEMQVRQAIERLVRNQIRPTEDQMKKLQAIDSRMLPQRRQLDQDEMATRRDLREAMRDTANIDQQRIGQLLDRLITFPAKRAALLESEQKELTAVLTPLQRARYQAIQEQIRRRIDQGRGGPPPGGPPPGQ